MKLFQCITLSRTFQNKTVMYDFKFKFVLHLISFIAGTKKKKIQNLEITV